MMTFGFSLKDVSVDIDIRVHFSDMFSDWITSSAPFGRVDLAMSDSTKAAPKILLRLSSSRGF
jgi:hypothetical protein